MSVIHELSPHLADLIAAGEVVERPASVAKELLENAIDAGSTRITIEIENGGISYLRIADNGCGMSEEDAPVAFRRHATSKLKTEADLSAIGTLASVGKPSPRSHPSPASTCLPDSRMESQDCICIWKREISLHKRKPAARREQRSSCAICSTTRRRA